MTNQVVNVSNLRCYDKNSIIIVKSDEHDEDSSHSSPGLRTLFNVHRLVGCSFFGASVSSRPLPLVTKIPTHDVSEPLFISTMSTNSTNREHSTAQLIIYLQFCSMTIFHLFSYVQNVYLWFIAPSLLRLIRNELSPQIESTIERRIGLRIITIEILIITSLVIVLHTAIYLQFRKFYLLRGIDLVFNTFSLFAPIALIGYINYCLCHLIKRSSMPNKIDLSIYIEQLLQVGSMVKRVNHLMGPAILLLISNSLIVCICTVCLSLTDWKNTFYISITGFLIYAMVLFWLVNVSSCIYETGKCANDHFRKRFFMILCDDHHHNNQRRRDCHLISSQLLILGSLEKSLRMSPLNLFYLTRSYIVTFLAFTLSYSVILIQTSESTVTGR
ncbi:hypothetical protein RDWZM_002342 [Blomia tropicalis]|uniref:Uncharacterized protein n=1 Tax=Blomia tropicalis TaxID=40697 RepID=A0A9Q0MFY4_BLOTA|nr:hypothetical protein RDWZM_002342 [Blomia tropicalis]